MLLTPRKKIKENNFLNQLDFFFQHDNTSLFYCLLDGIPVTIDFHPPYLYGSWCPCYVDYLRLQFSACMFCYIQF